MHSEVNVLGSPLLPCSKQGYAMTGFARDGTCRTMQGDRGRHHVCVDLSLMPSFCGDTGQGEWCKEGSPCHDNSYKTCEKREWCACEWAVASFISKNGCDAVDLKCDSTNMRSLRHYKMQADKGDESAKEALSCILSKCNVDPQSSPLSMR